MRGDHHCPSGSDQAALRVEKCSHQRVGVIGVKVLGRLVEKNDWCRGQQHPGQ